MDEAAIATYLREVLALDPRDDAEQILAIRHSFLRPDGVVSAVLADDSEPDDVRSRLLARLNAIRRDFWQLSDAELAQRLTALQQVSQPEIVAAAARLQQVAQLRGDLRALAADRETHPTFVRALGQILIAPAAEANSLREHEQSWMRPEQNPEFLTARYVIFRTLQRMRDQYPRLFALEEAWLTELLQFDPIEETENHAALTVAGLAIIVSALVALVACVILVARIFA